MVDDNPGGSWGPNIAHGRSGSATIRRNMSRILTQVRKHARLPSTLLGDSLECASLERNTFKTLRTAHGWRAKRTVLGGYGFQEGGSAAVRQPMPLAALNLTEVAQPMSYASIKTTTTILL
jgi:hypothetical protein